MHIAFAFDNKLASVTLALLLMQGCYNPDLAGDGQFRCETGLCPEGFVCSGDRVCVRVNGGEDASGPDAAVYDAVVDDANLDAASNDDVETSDTIVLPKSPCELGQNGEIATNVTTNASFGFSVDRNGDRQCVAFVSGNIVHLAQRGAYGTVKWEDADIVARDMPAQLESPVNTEIVVGCFESTTAVAFGDVRQSSETAGEYKGLLRLYVEWGAVEQVHTVDLASSDTYRGVGRYLDVEMFPDEADPEHISAIEVAHQNETKAEVITARLDGNFETVETHSQTIDINFEYVPNGMINVQSGVHNRLVVREQEGAYETTLAFMLHGANETTLGSGPWYAQRSGLEAFRTGLPVAGAGLTRVPEAAQGIGAGVSEVSYIIWPQSENVLAGSAYGLKLIDENSDTYQITPAGVLLEGAGAPALAAHGATVGVTFLDDQENRTLGFTARLDPAFPEKWTPVLRFDEGLRDVIKADVVARAHSAGKVAFDVMYLTGSSADENGVLRYQEVVCSVPN